MDHAERYRQRERRHEHIAQRCQAEKQKADNEGSASDAVVEPPAHERTDDDSDEREDRGTDAGNRLGPAQALNEERERRKAHDVVREDAEIHEDDKDKVLRPQLRLRALRCICLCHRFLPLRAFCNSTGPCPQRRATLSSTGLTPKGPLIDSSALYDAGRLQPRKAQSLPDREI